MVQEKSNNEMLELYGETKGKLCRECSHWNNGICSLLNTYFKIILHPYDIACGKFSKKEI